MLYLAFFNLYNCTMRRFTILLSLGAAIALSYSATGLAVPARAAAPPLSRPALTLPDTTQDASRPMFGGSIGNSQGVDFTDPTRPQFGGGIGSSQGQP